MQAFGEPSLNHPGAFNFPISHFPWQASFQGHFFLNGPTPGIIKWERIDYSFPPSHP